MVEVRLKMCGELYAALCSRGQNLILETFPAHDPTCVSTDAQRTRRWEGKTIVRSAQRVERTACFSGLLGIFDLATLCFFSCPAQCRRPSTIEKHLSRSMHVPGLTQVQSQYAG